MKSKKILHITPVTLQSAPLGLPCVNKMHCFSSSHGVGAARSSPSAGASFPSAPRALAESGSQPAVSADTLWASRSRTKSAVLVRVCWEDRGQNNTTSNGMCSMLDGCEEALSFALELVQQITVILSLWSLLGLSFSCSVMQNDVPPCLYGSYVKRVCFW